jgi:phospholipid transport system substrate-binding protein
MKSFVRILILALMLGPASWAFASVGPSERIQKTVDEVLQVLRDPGLTKEQRRDLVRVIVRPRFDYSAMSQIILAQEWRKASSEQKDRFVGLFRDLIERTYFSAMDSYEGETVRMGRERKSENRAIVQTYVKASTKEVPVDYKLRLKDDDWLAYDVTVDGVSLVSNYRTSFRNLIRDKGMDGLLAELEHKIEELKSVSNEEAEKKPR